MPRCEMLPRVELLVVVDDPRPGREEGRACEEHAQLVSHEACGFRLWLVSRLES